MSIKEKHVGPFAAEARRFASDRFGLEVGADRFAEPGARAPGLAVKRMFDVMLALIGLVLLSPVFLAIAAAIKIDSRGPVLFRQARNGKHRARFKIWKFRSMVTSAGTAPFRQATRDDERVTRVGRVLRRTSLDELPQLWNVLNGTMSLVGPRPHPPSLDDDLAARFPGYGARFGVVPGITGWAQVNGFRGESVTDAAMQGRVEHDLFYVAHRSFWMDLKILFLTLFSAKPFENAY
jgi:polysaccharide biosynthesis protein PslA